MVEFQEGASAPVAEVDNRTWPSESGYGWTTDGMYPFFPGVPCVHCGKFVGRDGIFNVEHFEMSNEIASMDAEHVACSDTFYAQFASTTAPEALPKSVPLPVSASSVEARRTENQGAGDGQSPSSGDDS